MNERIRRELGFLAFYLVAGAIADVCAWMWWLASVVETAESDINPWAAFAHSGQPRLTYFLLILAILGLVRVATVALAVRAARRAHTPNVR